MTKLNRVTGKLFGETASSTDDPILGPEIGQFGSAKAGTYLGTGDIATIQNLPAWSNGWIDAVTPTNQYPALPERTGVDKVLSYQENYILQRGIPEWDASTDYYINCFCSYNGKIYISLTDENLNNKPDESINNWSEYDSGDSGNYANQDINNLTTFGNARLQYAPFSINRGTLDEDGYNATLHLPPGTSVEADWVQPKMTSMGTWGGDSFAIKYTDGGSMAAGQIWNWFDGNVETYCRIDNIHNPSVYLYFPEPICPTSFSYMALHNASLGYPPVQCTVYGSNDESTWEQLGQTPFNEHIGDYNTNGCTFSTQNHYQYLKLTFTADWAIGQYETSIREINISGKIIATATSSIICEPCLMTTCDGRTVQVENQITQDFANLPNSEYHLLRDINTGFLTATNNFIMQKNAPSALSLISWTNPNLSSNGTWDGSSFAVKASNQESDIYKMFDGSSSTYYVFGQHQWEHDLDVYNPNQVILENVSITVLASSSVAYPPSWIKIYGSNDMENFDFLAEVATANGSDGQTFNVAINSNTAYNYFRFHLRCQQPVGGYVQGAIREITMSGKEVNGVDTSVPLYWLDISKTPANLFLLQNNTMQTVNNLVLIGSCTVNNGIITALHNRYFNACPYHRDLVDSYQNGASVYAVYSDGWCEQEGRYSVTSSSPNTINLLKEMKDTSYNIIVTVGAEGAGDATVQIHVRTDLITTTSFAIQKQWAINTGYYFWQVGGYIEKINIITGGSSTPWTQPVLSADGTMGGSEFAVWASSVYNGTAAYYAVNDNISNHWVSSSPTASYKVYNPDALKVTSFSVTNANTSSPRAIRSGEVYGSNDDTNYTLIQSFTNADYTTSGVWSINLTNNKYYKYYRFDLVGDGTYVAIAELKLTAFV